jgi:polysaccharide biosynthesis protein PslG
MRLRRLAAGLVAMLCVLAWLTSAGQAEGTAVGRAEGMATGRAAGKAAHARAAQSSLLGGVSTGLAASSDAAEAARSIALAHQLHARLVRIEVPWATLEPRGPGQLEPVALANTDRIVEDAATDGIGVVMLVQGTPCWASSAPASLLRACRPQRGGRATAWPPTQPSQFAAFVAYLAARYGSRLTALEIWNEPDQSNEDYLAGPHKAERYAAILRAAYPAIKQADPHVEVLAGALVGSNGAFLRALYAAGIKGYYDALAVHYYDLTLASLRSIHETQLANGDDKPLWLNEFGWSSCWPKRKIEQEQACVTPQVQAQNIADTFRALEHIPYVAAAILYKLRDGSNESFGVVSAAGGHKPAFAALARALGAPGTGAIQPTALALHRSGSHVVASGSAAVGDFMELEAFQGSRLRYRALFTLNRFNRYAISLPSALGTSGLRVRVFSYPVGIPSPAAQRSI